jgi:hypothetical protein
MVIECATVAPTLLIESPIPVEVAALAQGPQVIVRMVRVGGMVVVVTTILVHMRGSEDHLGSSLRMAL